MSRGMTAKKLVSWGSIILLFVLIFGYGIWRSRDLLFGIRITTDELRDGMTVSAPVLDFSGTARHANGLTVNGQQVPLSENGTWHDSIALMRGYNVITITAKDKFERTIKKEYRVYYQTQEQ